MWRETGRIIFTKNKYYIYGFVKLFRFFPKSVLHFFWDCTTNHSQLFFIAIRYIILKALIRSCGDNVRIGTNVQILGWDKLSVGNNVSIHSNCYIDANGEIVIGDNVSIAHNTSILSTNHNWNDISIPIKYNPITHKKVIVSENVWIGCGSRILAGVRIDTRSIIAAGAVVTKDVPSNTIFGGIPAKLIKEI